ncbi:MAG: DUF4384 domain-containing protein [Pyrinomonadaceae bacterium]
MRGKYIRTGLGLLVLLLAGAMLFINQSVGRAQGGNPLIDDRPVTIVRKAKPNRVKRARKRRRVVERVPLLKLQWRVLKVKDNGSDEETSPLAMFHVGDRLRLSVRTNQDGYLYIIHQPSPTQPGQIIFPDSRVNGGRNDVTKTQELILPSNCPAGMPARDCSLIVAPPAGREVFTLVFTRDPITDLPNTAAESTGGIPVETLVKLRSESGQALRRIKGTTPLSVLVVNTDTKDNEEIFETLLLNKGQ